MELELTVYDLVQRRDRVEPQRWVHRGGERAEPGRHLSP